MKMCRKARANAGQVNTMSGVSMSYFCRSPDSCFRFGVHVVKLTEKGQLDPNKAFLQGAEFPKTGRRITAHLKQYHDRRQPGQENLFSITRALCITTRKYEARTPTTSSQSDASVFVRLGPLCHLEAVHDDVQLSFWLLLKRLTLSRASVGSSKPSRVVMKATISYYACRSCKH
jgi:hypothetical protein